MIPSVSIILPVYNGEEYISESIESILSQTFSNFELIIIDDGSTDYTSKIVESFDDPRIRFYQQENVGLSQTLNRGIALARGLFIARQDADDISLKTRIEKQVEFLNANPSVGMVGTWARICSASKLTRRIHKHPIDNQLIQFDLLFDNPFVHSSIMLRRTVIDCVGFYTEDTNRQPPEDYELWSRVARKYEVANIPDALVIYREVKSSISRTRKNYIAKKVACISAENIAWWLGERSTTSDIINLSAIYHNNFDDIPENIEIDAIIKIIEQAAYKIENNTMHPILRRNLSKKIRKLRLQYYLYRCDAPFIRWIDKHLRYLKRSFGL